MSHKSCLQKLDEVQLKLVKIRKVSVCHFCAYGSFSDILEKDKLETVFDGCSLKSNLNERLRYDCSDFAPDTELK